MQSLHYAPDEIVVFLEDIRRTPMNKSYRQKRYIKVSTEQQDVQLLLQWGDIADKYYGKVKDIYELLVAARKKGDADLWSDGLDMCNDLLNETWGNVATNADYSNVADAAERLGGYEKYNLQSKIRQTLSSVADWKNQLKDLSGLTDPLGSDPQEERSELEWLFQNLSLMQYASDDIGDFIDDALEGGNMYG
jgi:hypothetical protein